MSSVIEAKDLSFVYEGEKMPVLRDVNFKLTEGNIVFISGLSGSGKSTLLNIINGLIPEVIEGKVIGDCLLMVSQILTWWREVILSVMFFRIHAVSFSLLIPQLSLYLRWKTLG